MTFGSKQFQRAAIERRNHYLRGAKLYVKQAQPKTFGRVKNKSQGECVKQKEDEEAVTEKLIAALDACESVSTKLQTSKFGVVWEFTSGIMQTKSSD